MTYNDALNIISAKQSLGIKPGLTRIMDLLNVMGNPQDKLKIIHIAGTNGKGTVACTIADALKCKGLRVGLFTSPWIMDYREQIQINGDFISEDDFAYYVSQFHNNDCTEFELLTAIMYKYFFDSGVDYAVVECGMGGKGDATNVEKENVCSVLTSISLDHTAFLGSTIEKIINEKEGIIRNSPCFRYESTGDFNQDNLTLCSKVLSYLGFGECDSLKKPSARQQYVNNILVDGGHNPAAAVALEPLLNDEVAVIGMMADKNIDGYLSAVAPHCKKIIAVTVDNPRALSAAELAQIASKYCRDVTAIDNPVQAVQYAKQNGLSLVCGSFYLIREVRKELF